MNNLQNLIKNIILIIISLFGIIQVSYAVEEITYYHNDISGTPLLATNMTGNVLWKEAYRPYGEKLLKSTASQSNKIGFQGKPFDDELGLSYVQARYYDPVLGRFTGIDPLDYQEDNLHSFNRYAYANNNPYKYIDPDGNTPVLAMVLMAGGTTLTIDSLIDGQPPQAKIGRTVNFAAKSFNKSAINQGITKGMMTEARATSKVHANSKSSSKAQHLYEIKDSWNNNTVCKTGISCGALKRDGTSPRAQAQVNKWNKEPGNEGRYSQEVVERIPGGPNAREKALNAELKNANLHRATLDITRHSRP